MIDRLLVTIQISFISNWVLAHKVTYVKIAFKRVDALKVCVNCTSVHTW